MLDNMEHTAVVKGRCRESDGEGLVFVLTVKVDEARTTFYMLHLVEGCRKLAKLSFPYKAKTVFC